VLYTDNPTTPKIATRSEGTAERIGSARVKKRDIIGIMPNSVHFSKKIILSFAQSPTQRKISVPVYGEMHMEKYDRKMTHSHLCRTSKMVDRSKQRMVSFLA
jgi:hypothetical protein